MQISSSLMWVMVVGIVIGGIDRILNNKMGIGQKFEEGFMSLGPLALGMVGIMCLTPVIANIIGPGIKPLLSVFNLDPSILGSLLASDTGGYSLAMTLADDSQAGLYYGLIVASMFGTTIAFSIPVGLGIIEKKDYLHFSNGILIGLITVPIGSILGGVIAGFNLKMIFINSIPIIVISAVLVICLLYIPKIIIRSAVVFGKVLVIIITIGLVAASIEALTGLVIIPGMEPIEKPLSIVSYIGVVLLGTFPVLAIILKVLKKPLDYIGKRYKLDEYSTAGIVYTLANSIPVYTSMKKMNIRGKILNSAWLVSATAALGDHLGFTASVYPRMVIAVVLSKLAAGFLAIALCLAYFKVKTIE